MTEGLLSADLGLGIWSQEDLHEIPRRPEVLRPLCKVGATRAAGVAAGRPGGQYHGALAGVRSTETQELASLSFRIVQMASLGECCRARENLNVSAPLLFVGGHENHNFSLLPHDLPVHRGFDGCIFDLSVRSTVGASQVIF